MRDLPVSAGARTAIALGIVGFVGFAMATDRSVGYGDLAEFQLLGAIGGVAHANGYPVYIAAANLFSLLPLGSAAEAAYRVNLLSAVLAGGTLSLIATFVARITDSIAAGVCSAIVFGSLGTLWATATVALPYTFDALATMTVLVLLTAWAAGGSERMLYLGLFIWGVSFGGHSGTVLLAPGVVILAFPTRSRRSLPTWPSSRHRVVLYAAGAFAAGLMVYIGTWFYQDARNVPHDFLRTVAWIAPDTWAYELNAPARRFAFQATNEEWRPAFGALSLRRTAYTVDRYLTGLPDIFTPAAVVLMAVGACSLLGRHPRVGMALVGIYGAQAAFWLTYDIEDLPKHLLSNYLMLSILLGGGVGELYRWVNRAFRTFDAAQDASAASWRRLLVHAAVIVPVAWFVLLPLLRTPEQIARRGWRVEDDSLRAHVLADPVDATRAGLAMVSTLKPQAVVFATWKEVFTVAYVARFNASRPDVLVVRADHRNRDLAVQRYASRPMYFVESPLAWVAPELQSRISHNGMLYELAPE